MVEGSFPPYEEAFPARYGFVFEVDGGEFEGLLRQAFTAVKGSDHTAVRFTANGTLELRAMCEDVTFDASVPSYSISATDAPLGDMADVVFGFNPRYLADAVALAGGGRVEIALGDGWRPGMKGKPDGVGSAPARITKAAGGDWRALVMPVSLD